MICLSLNCGRRRVVAGYCASCYAARVAWGLA